MRLDDLRKLATGKVLFSLDRVIAPALVRVLYLLGLAGLLVWAVRHLFASFRWGFGSGLWGLIEIAVFGLMLFVALRIACEAILVYFRTSADAETTSPRGSRSLLDEVREALEELAAEEPDDAPAAADGPRWTPQRSWGPAPGAARPAAPEGAAAATAANPGVLADVAPEYDIPEGVAETPADETEVAPRQPAVSPGAIYD